MINTPRKAGRLARLIESELEKAELILAAKAIPDKLQEMAEKLAKIEADDMMPLLDQLKTGFGPQAAERFSQAVTGKVRELLDEVRSAKDAIDTEISNLEGVANGEPVATDMGDSMNAAPPPAPGGMDDFANAEGEPGPGDDSEEDFSPEPSDPSGRMRKEGRTIRGRQIEGAIKKLRESKNPDAVVLAEFRSNLTKHSIKEAAIRTAKTFRIDLSDVVSIVKEAKKEMSAKQAKFFGGKAKGKDAKKPTEKDDSKACKTPAKGEKPCKAEPPKKKVTKEVAEGARKAPFKNSALRHEADAKKTFEAEFRPGSMTYLPQWNDETQWFDIVDRTKPIGGGKYQVVKTSVSPNRDTAKRKAKEFGSGRSLEEASPQGSQGSMSPAQLRAARDQQKQTGTSQQQRPKDNEVMAGAPDASSIPGKVQVAPGKQPEFPDQNQNGGSNQANGSANSTAPVNKNASAQPMTGNKPQGQPQGQPQNGVLPPKDGSTAPVKPGMPNATTDEQGQPVNGQKPPVNGQKQPVPANGQTQMVQNGDDAPAKDVQPKDNAKNIPVTQQPGFDAQGVNKGNGGQVTMMSKNTPLPKPKHSLMGSSGFAQANRENNGQNESALLRKAFSMLETAAIEEGMTAAQDGLPVSANPHPAGTKLNTEWSNGHGKLSGYFPTRPIREFMEPDMPVMPVEDQPEAHARLVGYVIRDNHGHTHGCKWVTHQKRDEGAPKIYKDKIEAQILANEWNKTEAEQDGEFLDNVVYTVGRAYSDGNVEFPA